MQAGSGCSSAVAPAWGHLADKAAPQEPGAGASAAGRMEDPAQPTVGSRAEGRDGHRLQACLSAWGCHAVGS